MAKRTNIVSSVGASVGNKPNAKAPVSKSSVKSVKVKVKATRKPNETQVKVKAITDLDELLSVKEVGAIIKGGRIQTDSKKYGRIHALVGQTTARKTFFEAITLRGALKINYMGAFNAKEVASKLIALPAQAIIDSANEALDRRRKAWSSAAIAGKAIADETQADFLRAHAQAIADAKRGVHVAMGAALTYVGAAHDKYVQSVKLSGADSVKVHSRVSIIHYWSNTGDTASRKANSDFSIGE